MLVLETAAVPVVVFDPSGIMLYGCVNMSEVTKDIAIGPILTLNTQLEWHLHLLRDFLGLPTSFAYIDYEELPVLGIQNIDFPGADTYVANMVRQRYKESQGLAEKINERTREKEYRPWTFTGNRNRRKKQ